MKSTAIKKYLSKSTRQKDELNPEICLNALFAGEVLDYRSLSAQETETLYNACCWLCTGMLQCNQREKCTTECCKSARATESMQDICDALPSLHRDSISITVASLFHPEIAAKLDIEK